MSNARYPERKRIDRRTVRPWYFGAIGEALDMREPVGSSVRPGTHITPREKQIVMLVARGQSSRWIANELATSHQTVKNHIANAKIRLTARNRTELVMAAIGNGYFQSFDVADKA